PISPERDAQTSFLRSTQYNNTPPRRTPRAETSPPGLSNAVFGSRIIGGGAIDGGMPLYKYVANRLLTAAQNLLMGAKLSEYHTGYRAWSRKVLQQLPLASCSDDFVFDNQMIAQAMWAGFRIGEISCPTRYFAEASSINFGRSCTYGLGVLATALEYRLSRWGLLRSRLFASGAELPPITALPTMAVTEPVASRARRSAQE